MKSVMQEENTVIKLKATEPRYSVMVSDRGKARFKRLKASTGLSEWQLMNLLLDTYESVGRSNQQCVEEAA